MKKIYNSPQIYVHSIKCGTILAGSLHYTSDNATTSGGMEARRGRFSRWEEDDDFEY